MKVLNARIDMNERYDQHPTLDLLVDEFPDPEDMVFEERNGIYYAEHGGYARYLYYKQPGEGYGGSIFQLKMKDGSTKECIGPWSSRASCVNAQGFGPVCDVSLTNDTEAFHRGYTFIAGAVLVSLAEEGAKLAGGELYEDTELGEYDKNLTSPLPFKYYYPIIRAKMTCSNCGQLRTADRMVKQNGVCRRCTQT